MAAQFSDNSGIDKNINRVMLGTEYSQQIKTLKEWALKEEDEINFNVFLEQFSNVFSQIFDFNIKGFSIESDKSFGNRSSAEVFAFRANQTAIEFYYTSKSDRNYGRRGLASDERLRCLIRIVRFGCKVEERITFEDGLKRGYLTQETIDNIKKSASGSNEAVHQFQRLMIPIKGKGAQIVLGELYKSLQALRPKLESCVRNKTLKNYETLDDLYADLALKEKACIKLIQWAEKLWSLPESKPFDFKELQESGLKVRQQAAEAEERQTQTKRREILNNLRVRLPGLSNEIILGNYLAFKERYNAAKNEGNLLTPEEKNQAEQEFISETRKIIQNSLSAFTSEKLEKRLSAMPFWEVGTLYNISFYKLAIDLIQEHLGLIKIQAELDGVDFALPQKNFMDMFIPLIKRMQPLKESESCLDKEKRAQLVNEFKDYMKPSPQLHFEHDFNNNIERFTIFLNILRSYDPTLNVPARVEKYKNFIEEIRNEASALVSKKNHDGTEEANLSHVNSAEASLGAGAGARV